MYQPRKGDFGVVRSNGIVARLIQLGTLSRWNHAFIYLGDNVVAEAKPFQGITISPVSNYSKIAWNQHQELTDIQREEVVKKAHSLLGKTYGFLDIFIIFLRILGFKFLGGALLEKLSLRQGIICSEYVAICYQAAEVNLTNKPEYLVTPGDLAEVLIYQ
jgi:hypothetical protein